MNLTVVHRYSYIHNMNCSIGCILVFMFCRELGCDGIVGVRHFDAFEPQSTDMLFSVNWTV